MAKRVHKPKKVQKRGRPHRVWGRLVRLGRFVHRRRVLVTVTSFIMIPAVLGYLGSVLIVVPSLQESWVQFSARMGFDVHEIMVEGRERTPTVDVMRAVNMKRGVSLFRHSPITIKEKLEQLTWVQSATVERRWPHLIYVRLVEHSPLALWQSNAKFYLVNQHGEVIQAEINPVNYGQLLQIVGPGAPANVAGFLAVLNSVPDIQQRVTAAIYVSQRRWDLVLDNRIRVKLPQIGMSQAINHLLKMERDHSLASSNITTIDLRLPDRTFLYVADGKG